MRSNEYKAISNQKADPMKKNLLLVLSLAGIIAGCTTMTPEQRRAADGQTCRNYGFKAGTDAFSNCLLQLDLDRRADTRAWQNNQGLYATPMIIYRPVPVRVKG